MPQAWDSLKVFVSISFVVLSKFYFSKLYIILFTRDRTFVVRGARVKVYKVLIYRYNFIFSTKEGLFLQTISVSFILIAIKLIDLKDRIATHIAALTLYIVLCPLFRSSCHPHEPPLPSLASLLQCPQQSYLSPVLPSP